MKVAMTCAGFTAGEADQLRRAMATFKFTGGVSKFKDKLVEGHGQERLHPRICREDVYPARRLRKLRFPGKPRRQLRADRLCKLQLDEMPPSRCLLRVPAQQPADGFLQRCPDRPGCPEPQRRSPAGLRQPLALGLHHGTDRHFRPLCRSGLACVLSRDCPPTRPPALSWRGPNSRLSSADDMWRRSGVSPSSLVKLAEADAFLPSLQLERRQALWDIKALRDEPLELWAAAAEREAKVIAEMQEPDVALKSMTEGREVVEDYSHTGLTLRAHPISFSPERPRPERYRHLRRGDGDNETGGGFGLLVWFSCDSGQDQQRASCSSRWKTSPASSTPWSGHPCSNASGGFLMTASMMAINGRIQREGEVVHLVAQRLFDFSADLSSVGNRDGDFPLPHGRGDQVKHGGGPDTRDNPKPVSAGARHLYS